MTRVAPLLQYMLRLFILSCCVFSAAAAARPGLRQLRDNNSAEPPDPSGTTAATISSSSSSSNKAVMDLPRGTSSAIKDNRATAGPDEILVEGYIMDRFCIEQGTLFDTGLTTLEHADKHTVHCLLDPEPCLWSTFEVLSDPLEGETLFRRSYVLDTPSKILVVGIAKDVGVCDTCTGKGTLEAGFKASMIATIVTEEDASSVGAGPIISVRMASAILSNDTTIISNTSTDTMTNMTQLDANHAITVPQSNNTSSTMEQTSQQSQPTQIPIQMTKTNSPTWTPTQTPSFYPTLQPTQYPSVCPTSFPTWSIMQPMEQTMAG